MSNPEFAKRAADLLRKAGKPNALEGRTISPHCCGLARLDSAPITSRMRIGMKFPHDRPADRARACASACEHVDNPQPRELQRLRKSCEVLASALEALVACQNGPPLIKYADAWNKAMESASKALGDKK